MPSPPPTTPTIHDLIREQRETVLRIDQALAAKLLREYRRRVAGLAGATRAVEDEIRRAGEIDDPERWVRESDAAGRLLAAAEHGIAEFGAYAAGVIEQRRVDLIRLAVEHDEKLTYASIIGDARVTPATRQAIRAAFTAPPVRAVEHLVAALQPGSPVRDVFDGYGEQASRRIGEKLVDGLTHGRGAAQIGRELRESMDGSASAALTTARTETHRAYRSAHLERWRANPRVYVGWSWHANLDTRTCPVCIAKHGSVHDLDEDFAGHPNCRCRPLPITRPLSEILGSDSDEVRRLESDQLEAQRRPTGEAWFAKQTREVQRGVLGPLKHEDYAAGRIKLVDVVVRTEHERWGPGLRTASRREALANAQRRRRRERSRA